MKELPGLFNLIAKPLGSIMQPVAASAKLGALIYDGHSLLGISGVQMRHRMVTARDDCLAAMTQSHLHRKLLALEMFGSFLSEVCSWRIARCEVV